MGCTCEKVWRRKLSKVGHKYNNSDNPPTLSDAQKAVIRNNWQVLKCNMSNIGVITYVSMFESSPKLMEVFSKFKGRDVGELKSSGLVRQHALRVMATIDKVITRLDEPSALITLLKESGAHHKMYKVPRDYIQVILPHFLNAIKPHIEDHWCDDIENAWKTMFAIIIYYMNLGYKEQKRSRIEYIVESTT